MSSSCSTLSRSSLRRKTGTWRCLPCSKEMVCCHLHFGTSRNLALLQKNQMGSSCSTLPRTPPKKSDGFFLQYSSSLMPCLQDSHLALYAWQQLLSGGVVYFSQPGVPRKFLGFFLQNCSSLMPSAQERHLALYAWPQIGGPGCSILKA